MAAFCHLCCYARHAERPRGYLRKGSALSEQLQKLHSTYDHGSAKAESVHLDIFHVVSLRGLGHSYADHCRTLGAVIILTMASLSPDLRQLVPDINELQSMAIENIRPWAFSSLVAVVDILEDMQRKCQRLSRIQ